VTAPAGSWWQDPAVAAYLASGIASAGGAIWSAKAQSDAAKEAATIQANAANNALTEQQRQFNAMMTREKQVYDDQAAMGAPWRDAGGRALNQLEQFDTTNPNFGMTQFNADPGYSFRLSEGRKALENSAAARGGLLSGNTLKGISDYGQQSASQEYQNAFNRYQTERGTKLNRLQSLAGIGQSAVQQAGQAGQNYANATGQASQNYASGAGNVMMSSANAQAGGITGAASANASGWMGAANSLTNALSGYYNNQQSQNMLNALTRR
jgi:hypothetical protein